MPPIERSRRSILRTASLLSLLSVTGCLQSSQSFTSNTATKRIGTTSEEQQSEKPESETGRPDPQYYDFGEWHRSGDIRYTVTDWGLYSSFRRDDGTARYEVPGRRLLIADAKAENVTDETVGLHAPYFAALTGDDSYRETGHINHPDLSDRISIADIRRVEHAARWAPQSVSIEPHSVRKFSIVCLVPEAITVDALEIGYEGPKAKIPYPVRWMPK